MVIPSQSRVIRWLVRLVPPNQECWVDSWTTLDNWITLDTIFPHLSWSFLQNAAGCRRCGFTKFVQWVQRIKCSFFQPGAFLTTCHKNRPSKLVCFTGMASWFSHVFTETVCLESYAPIQLGAGAFGASGAWCHCRLCIGIDPNGALSPGCRSRISVVIGRFVHQRVAKHHWFWANPWNPSLLPSYFSWQCCQWQCCQELWTNQSCQKAFLVLTILTSIMYRHLEAVSDRSICAILRLSQTTPL